jgi:hypothetical protein
MRAAAHGDPTSPMAAAVCDWNEIMLPVRHRFLPNQDADLSTVKRAIPTLVRASSLASFALRFSNGSGRRSCLRG